MTYPPPPLPEDEEEQEDPKPGVPSTHALAATQYTASQQQYLDGFCSASPIKLLIGDSPSSTPANTTAAASDCPSTHRRTVDTCCSLSNNPEFTSCRAHDIAEQTAKHALASIGRKYLIM
jgi:hypothetical protein